MGQDGHDSFIHPSRSARQLNDGVEVRLEIADDTL
jgi:hypothetical protein